MLVLLGRQLGAGGEQFAAIFQRLIEVYTTFVGVAHVVCCHVVSRFRNQVLKQVAVRLGNANRFQRHTVFAQRRFHILEGFTYTAVFRQQVVTQRAGNGAGDTAVQRRFNQTVEFTTVGRRAQTACDDAQIEHQRMVVGNRVELLELHAFDSIELVFQLLQAQHARLTFVHRFGQQLRRLDGGRQTLNSKRFDIDFAVAPGNLLQTYAYDHALVTRVHDVQHGVTHASFQLTVQAFIARTTGGPGFRGVTDVQHGQVWDQRRD